MRFGRHYLSNARDHPVQPRKPPPPMHLQQLPDGSIRLSRLNSWDVQTFRSLPALADYGADPQAEKRLLPPPAIESDLTPEMGMDWVEYVIPELRESFARNLETVLADLSQLTMDETEVPAEAADAEPAGENSAPGQAEREVAEMPYFSLTIPAGHAEPWFRAMNQARIVLSTRYGIDSENIPDLSHLLASGKLEHWFQYELFVSLQGWLVEAVLDAD